MADTTRKVLSDEDFSTLSNICRSAASKYEEIAAEFRKAEKAKSSADVPSGMPNGPAAGRLADQFDRQRKEALEYACMFDATVEATFSIDTTDEEPESPRPGL